MDQDSTDSTARVAGSDTGPLPPQGPGTGYTGQPTTYVPPDIRPQGTSSGSYTAERPSAPPPPPHLPQGAIPPAMSPLPGYHERRPHRTPLLGPLLLISAGVVFLLNNLGVLPWSVWETLGRLWPLILIAIGLDLVIGRRSQLFSMLVVLAVLAAGAAIVYTGGGFTAPGAIASTPLSLRLTNAEWANVHVDLAAGNLTLGSMSGDDRLLATGNLEYFENRGVPRQDVAERGSSADVEIAERAGGWHFGPNWFQGSRSPSWEIAFNERVPLSLEVDSGTGNISLDLERLQLRSLTLDSGTGNASIVLPSKANGATVEIEGGTGNLEVVVPQGVEARIEVDSGIGNANVDPRFSERDDDTYESSGYGTATNKLTIKIEHGLGNLNISSR